MNSFEITRSMPPQDAVHCVEAIIHAVLPKEARSVITTANDAPNLLRAILRKRFEELCLEVGDRVEILQTSRQHGLQSLRIGVYRPDGEYVPRLLTEQGEVKFPTLDIAHHTQGTLGLPISEKILSWQLAELPTFHNGPNQITALTPDLALGAVDLQNNMRPVTAPQIGESVAFHRPSLYLERNGQPMNKRYTGYPRPAAIFRTYLSADSHA